MSKLSGLLVLMAGIGMAAYALPARDTEQQASVTRIGVDVPATEGRAQSNGSRTFSPQQGIAGLANADVEPRETKTSVASATTASKMLPTAGLDTGSNIREVSAKSEAAPKLTDDDAKRVLAKDLQQELRRVGCYEGEISGSWNAQTRKAMAAFIARVNATLPVERPDYILLTLLQGHSANACGPECTVGQVAGPGGKCVASNLITASVADAPSRSALADEGGKPTSKRKVASRRVAATTPETSSWQTTVAASPAASQAAVLPAPVAAPTQAVAAAPAAPLPGRMSAGATIGSNVLTPQASITVERAPIGGRNRDETASRASVQPVEAPNTVAKEKSLPKQKVAAVAPSPPAPEASNDDEEEEARRRRQARAAAQREEARREEVRERARRISSRPAIVYARPAPVYVAPPARVYRAPSTPSYSASNRNWKHAIFNDITRMR